MLPGGGAICFGFGAAFSPCFRFSLEQLWTRNTASPLGGLTGGLGAGCQGDHDATGPYQPQRTAARCWALEVAQQNAKATKDALSVAKWLDRSRYPGRASRPGADAVVILPLHPAGVSCLMAVMQPQASSASDHHADRQMHTKEDYMNGSSNVMDLTCGNHLGNQMQSTGSGQYRRSGQQCSAEAEPQLHQLLVKLLAYGAKLIQAPELTTRACSHSPFQRLHQAMACCLSEQGI